MPQLEDLKKNLLEMTPDELRQRIVEIREDKKLRKTMPKARREKAKSKETARSTVLNALQGLSEEDKARLIAELGG